MIFCGFWALVDCCSGGIACEICLGQVRYRSPAPRPDPRYRGRPRSPDRPNSPELPMPSAPGCISGWRWGFCTIRSAPSACRRRVAALMAQFPPSDTPRAAGSMREGPSAGCHAPKMRQIQWSCAHRANHVDETYPPQREPSRGDPPRLGIDDARGPSVSPHIKRGRCTSAPARRLGARTLTHYRDR